jgi:hypothetical protein
MERAVLAVFGEAEFFFGGIGFFNKEDSTRKGGTVQVKFFFLKWEFIITDTGQQTRRYSAPIVRPASGR